jgi:hypothetical protein
MPKSKDRNEVICTDTRRNLTAHVLQLRYSPFPWMADPRSRIRDHNQTSPSLPPGPVRRQQHQAHPGGL